MHPMALVESHVGFVQWCRQNILSFVVLFCFFFKFEFNIIYDVLHAVNGVFLPSIWKLFFILTKYQVRYG